MAKEYSHVLIVSGRKMARRALTHGYELRNWLIKVLNWMARWLKGYRGAWHSKLGRPSGRGVRVGLEVGALRNCQELAVTYNRSYLC